MAKEIEVWGNGTTGLWSYGQSVNIPADYLETPCGDHFITRRIKQLSDTVYIRMKKSKGRFSKAIGILAPKTIVESVLEEAENTKQQRLAQRKVSAKYRKKKEAEKRAEMVTELMALYPRIPLVEAVAVVEHAFVVGSGRVGRVSALDVDEKITFALIAYIRHCHTDYDELMNEGWDRESARAQIGKAAGEILDRWKGNDATSESQQEPVGM